jgi:hypothetical protein
MSARRFLAALFGWVLVAGESSAWQQFVPYYGRGGPEGFAIYSYGLGDVNGDGFDDLRFTRVPSNWPLSPMETVVRAGNDGHLLYVMVPTTSNSLLEVGPMGDLDQDGHAEVGLSATGGIEIRSGATGSLYGIVPPPPWLFTQGFQKAAPLDDLDGDGFPEFIATTAAYQDNTGVLVYSGASLLPLYQFPPPPVVTQLGRSIGGVEDVNGDGVGEFFIGEPFYGPAGLPNAGRIWVYSGATGSVLASHEGTQALGFLGMSAVSVGDVNGDGLPELAALEAQGPVLLYALPTFALFGSISTPLAAEVDRMSDVDGDGVDDLLVWHNTYFQVYSPVSGQLLGGQLQSIIHTWPKSVGDVNGDGLGDVAALYSQAPGFLLPPPAVQILTTWGYSWPPALFETRVYVARNLDLAGPALVGGSAQFDVLATKHGGRPFQIVFAREAAYPGMQLGPFFFPLVPDDLFVASFTAGMTAVLDPAGHGTISRPIPANPALVGQWVLASGWVIDPSAAPLPIGCVLTGVEVTIQ